MNRRAFLKTGIGVVLGGMSDADSKDKTDFSVEQRYQHGASPWPLVLNTSTIRPASLEDKIKAAQQAGYDGIELWINELETWQEEKGEISELKKRIEDAGLFVANVIGLWNAMPPSEEEFQNSQDLLKKRMGLCAQVGAFHVAVIPQPDREDFDLKWGATCYKKILSMGREEFGIIPAFEFVGFFKGVHRFGQACAVAIDADDKDACLIMDTFHLYRGGSGFEGLRHIQGSLIANFHWNDVPSEPPRDQLGDEHRILPGEGILPLSEVIKSLVAIGYRGPLSLEIFKRDYWERDPETVAQMGKEAMLKVLEKALG